jgi:hypothetical protein
LHDKSHWLLEEKHMMPRFARVFFVWLVAAVGWALAAAPIALGQQPSKEAKKVDLADFLDLGNYYVKPFPAQKDQKTGFLVGGKNDSALIKGLTELNGRKIADLETDMRPGATSKVGSTKGFLGPDESLLEVLAADNRFVVEELGLSHQQLARHLHALGTIGYWQQAHMNPQAEFVYHDLRFKVKLELSRGYQYSPFLDGTKTNSYVEVTNLDSSKKIGYSLLVPYMIERYGFYEGKGTPYRVEPAAVIEIFDFLKMEAKENHK